MPLVLTILLLFFAFEADAACVCRCVNGAQQPVCDSAVDLKPRCVHIACPVPPPGAAPVVPKTVLPLGATSCDMAQVLNPDTRRYEWKRICR